MGKVIIITAVHNRKEITQAYVQNLVKQTYKNWLLLLVDDGSTDGTDIMVKERVSNLKILYGDGNLWWSGALQLAYKWVIENAENDDIVFISNDDILITEDFIERAVKILNNSDKSILSATGINIDNNNVGDTPIKQNYLTLIPQLGIYDGTADCCSTRAIFIRVKDFKITGGFRPKLLPHYASDYEFTIRANRRGLKIIGDKSLCYKYSDKTSGHHQWLNEKPNNLLKKMFSKKSVYNPIYGIIYIVLITPIYILPFALTYKLIRYVRNIAKYLFYIIFVNT